METRGTMQPLTRKKLLSFFIRKMTKAPRACETCDPGQTMRVRFLQFKPWIGEIKEEARGARCGIVEKAFREWKLIEAEGLEMLLETKWLETPVKR